MELGSAVAPTAEHSNHGIRLYGECLGRYPVGTVTGGCGDSRRAGQHREPGTAVAASRRLYTTESTAQHPGSH